MKTHRFLSAVLVTALLLALLPCEAFAVNADELPVGDVQVEASTEDVPVYDATTDTFVYQKQTESAVEAQMDEALKNALASNGRCALNDGRYEEYIDRIDVPEVFLSYYNLLVEGGDNDGENDFLITESTDDVMGGGDILPINFMDSDGNVTTCSMVVCGIAGTSEITDDDWSAKSGDTFTAYRSKYSEYYEYSLAVRAAFDRDHPEIFWVNAGGPAALWPMITNHADGVRTVTFYVGVITSDSWKSKYSSESDVRTAISDCYAAADAIVANAKGNDAWKVKYFNNWLTSHNEYNYYVAAGSNSSADPDAWECISALMGQTGYDGPVCEAYARAMKVLCDRVGIPCVLVVGTAKASADGESGGHMWNSVKVDGAWYGVDVTWDDPYVENGGAVSGYESEDFLLVGKNTLNDYDYAYSLSHPEENYMFSNSVCFTNGPEIENERYDLTHTEHAWDAGTVTTAATCTSEGVMTYTCTVCGETKTEAIDKLTAVPQVSVSVAKGSASKKVVLTGKVDNLSDTEGVITGHGLVYITSARLGYKTLTVGTSGRTKVTFGAYKTDGSYSYTITAASKTTRYVVRAWATYTDDSGNSVTVYSDPITFTYNSAQ